MGYGDFADAVLIVPRPSFLGVVLEHWRSVLSSSFVEVVKRPPIDLSTNLFFFLTKCFRQADGVRRRSRRCCTSRTGPCSFSSGRLTDRGLGWVAGHPRYLRMVREGLSKLKALFLVVEKVGARRRVRMTMSDGVRSAERQSATARHVAAPWLGHRRPMYRTGGGRAMG